MYCTYSDQYISGIYPVRRGLPGTYPVCTCQYVPGAWPGAKYTPGIHTQYKGGRYMPDPQPICTCIHSQYVPSTCMIRYVSAMYLKGVGI